jgi:hypothetical protein
LVESWSKAGRKLVESWSECGFGVRVDARDGARPVRSYHRISTMIVPELAHLQVH